jgi:hypothetical protein
MRAALAFTLSVLVSLCGVPLRAAPSPRIGIVVFADHARLGPTRASAGSTLFAGDRLTTEAEGSVQFRARDARFLLAGGGDVTLGNDGTAVTATLTAGTATFSSSNAKAFTLRFAGADVRPNTDEPTVGQVSIVGPEELLVKSTRGSLAFTVAGETRLVAEGAAYRVILNPTWAETTSARARGTNTPQAGAQRAGEISRVIPDVTVNRGGKNLIAAANFEVDWQDQINTLNNARARVGLDDGSVLNVGSDSLMRVVKHDAGAQQTELDLAYGKLRSRAQKIANPNGKYEVRTPAGVAGVVGTDFYVDYAVDLMNVVVFSGVVRVCNLAGVCQLVKAGEMTSVRKNDKSAPVPVPATIAMMTSAASDTEIGAEPALAASTGAAQRSDERRSSRPPISSGTSSFVWYAIGVAAVVTVIAVHKSYESPDRP